MSRSAPTSTNPNPSTRWFEWKGGDGALTYYDKETKERVIMKDGFKFLVLDQLSTVTGYNEKKKDGITSNEVRDVRADALLVKFFKSGTIANGLWADIKEKVVFNDGQFAASVYIAYKEGEELVIGHIKMTGCALGPWFDFVKKHRSEVNEKGITIKAGEETSTGAKGKIKFTPPVFSTFDASPETNEAAIALDRQLQDFLKTYLKQPIADKLDQRTGHAPEDENQEADEEVAARRSPAARGPALEEPEEDDIPF